MNIFKSNNRFKHLDENDNDRQNNYNRESSFKPKSNFKQTSNKFKTDKKEPDKAQFVMEETSFPELDTHKDNKYNKNNVKNVTPDTKLFVNLFTNKVEEPKYITEESKLTVITIDKKTHQMIIKNGSNKKNTEPILEDEEYKQIRANEEILEKLTDSYINWTNNYIETWGEEAYINRYVCPNYDYEYFDKLDELYEKELEKEFKKDMDQEMNNSFIRNDEYYE
jgi:hypothetical protein